MAKKNIMRVSTTGKGKKNSEGYIAKELGGTLGDTMFDQNVNEAVEAEAEVIEENKEVESNTITENKGSSKNKDKDKASKEDMISGIMNDKDDNIKTDKSKSNKKKPSVVINMVLLHDMFTGHVLPLVEAANYSEFKEHLVTNMLENESVMSEIKQMSAEIKSLKIKDMYENAITVMHKIISDLSDKIKAGEIDRISSDEFKTTQEEIINVNEYLLECIENINTLLKEYELDAETIVVLSYYRKSLKQIGNMLLYKLTKELKAILVDQFLGKNKMELISNLLKDIKISKPKKSKKKEDSDESNEDVIDLDEIKLEISHEEFSLLLANAKYNDCRESVKSLSYILKSLNEVEIKTVISILEEKIMEHLDALSDKDFIAPSLLNMAVELVSDGYIKPAKLIMDLIKHTIESSDDKHIKFILNFVKDSIITPILKDIKDIIIDFKKRDTLTISDYIGAFKIDSEIWDGIVESTEAIVKLIPGDVKCKLRVPSELALVGVDDMIMRYVLAEQLLSDILTDEYIEDNLNTYPQLKEFAESLLPKDSPETSLVDVVKNNKTRVIKHLQMQIITGL